MNSKPYEQRLRDFIKERVTISDSELATKSIDELKAMLPQPHTLKTPSEGFTLFDLKHSTPGAMRVAYKVHYLYSDGASCRIPDGTLFIVQEPTDPYRRASMVHLYWSERLRRVQAPFDQLRKQLLKDQSGMFHTTANMEEIERLFQECKRLKGFVEDALEQKQKAHPHYKTPEQQEAEAKRQMEDSARRLKVNEKIKAMEV